MDQEWTWTGSGPELDKMKGSLQNKLNLKTFSKMQNLTRHAVDRDKP